MKGMDMRGKWKWKAAVFEKEWEGMELFLHHRDLTKSFDAISLWREGKVVGWK